MILVIGGAGYVGSHTALRLRERGAPHIVFDSLVTGHAWAAQGSELIKGDIHETHRLAELLRKRRVTCVMHFAAHTDVGESMADPHRYYSNNFAGTLSILEAMRQAEVGQLVFSSTAAVYGEPAEVPIPESHAKEPTNAYGATKLAAERAIAFYGSAHGLASVRLRYFNACGADPEGRIGESHDPETHLIPRVLLSSLPGGDWLRVFGNDYDTPDGTCIRDYVHVQDLADAHLAALEWLDANTDSIAINLGDGEGHSVLEVIESARRVTGADLPYELAPRRPGDPARLVASNSLAAKELGWKPQIKELDTMVRHAWAWLSRPRV